MTRGQVIVSVNGKTPLAWIGTVYRAILPKLFFILLLSEIHMQFLQLYEAMFAKGKE
jgi:hypothetical protein